MNTPLGTPIRQAKLNLASKSMPLATEFKKLLNEQHQRLSSKHQQDLELIDDIRAYTKARLSIERDYTSALAKLTKQHSAHIAKKFTLLRQSDGSNGGAELGDEAAKTSNGAADSTLTDSKRLNNSNYDDSEEAASSLYRVWSEHIRRLSATSKYRAEQFEQLVIVVDKLKDIRAHKASIGKKSLDNHLRKIHEDLIGSMIDLDKAKKLYYEDESQAKKARENEEKIRKKRSGLLTKFTDLQAKKEKTSAQREANDIQSTQARNDYIMALAAANAHLKQYYFRDLNDFIRIIDDGILDHCKVFMATLSECDINSLKHSLSQGQCWAKMINLTGSQRTNSIFIESNQSSCLWRKDSLPFEACNEDPIQAISLEYNADYALQHEIDKWFTWFKKECRNLSQLMHALEQCKRAAAEGKKTIELNGQGSEDLDSKIIELKQHIRKSEAAKLKAQARLKVIKEGGMQIEEWSAVEQEIRADMARAQELEAEARRAQELASGTSSAPLAGAGEPSESSQDLMDKQQQQKVNQLHVSSDSLDEADSSMQNLASFSRSASNTQQQQQQQANNNQQISDYSALADPTLAWQDDPSSAWNTTAPAQATNYNVVVTDAFSTNKDNQEAQDANNNNVCSSTEVQDDYDAEQAYRGATNHYDLLSAQQQGQQQQGQPTSMTVQSSSPLSAIMDGGGQNSASPYPGLMGEAYKSDYECDYNRTTGQLGASSAGSAAIDNSFTTSNNVLNEEASTRLQSVNKANSDFDDQTTTPTVGQDDIGNWLNRRVIALYSYDAVNDDDLPFNEGDILHILDITDYNWARACNEATQAEGFIPTSYVKLLEDQEGVAETSAWNSVDAEKPNDSCNNEVVMEQTFAETSSYNQPKKHENARSSHYSESTTANNDDDAAKIEYCRALYDYEPDKDEPEEDGLPHLRLKQGELLKIVDTDENDGWWLVERDSTGERGHVHSILVEEIDPNQPGEDDDEAADDDDDDEGSEYSDYDPDKPVRSMPNFEPPKPVELEDDGVEDEKSNQETTESDRLHETITIRVATPEEHEDNQREDQPSVETQIIVENHDEMLEQGSSPCSSPPKLESFEDSPIDADVRSSGDQKRTNQPISGAENQSSDATTARSGSVGGGTTQLVATSFIIIEPTPDVEHVDIEEAIRARLEAEQQQQQAQEDDVQATKRPVVKYESSVPPSDVCYSVVDEDFAFDEQPRPPKRPNVEINTSEVEEKMYSDHPGAGGIFDQSNLNPIYKNKADDFSKQIIDQAISFTYGIPIDSKAYLRQ